MPDGTRVAGDGGGIEAPGGGFVCGPEGVARGETRETVYRICLCRNSPQNVASWLRAPRRIRRDGMTSIPEMTPAPGPTPPPGLRGEALAMLGLSLEGPGFGTRLAQAIVEHLNFRLFSEKTQGLPEFSCAFESYPRSLRVWAGKGSG
jgi:hypothetical protein